MPKPVILLDCDGPLADFHSMALRWLAQQYPELYTGWKPTAQGFIQNSLPKEHAQALDFANAAPGVAAGLAVVPGAKVAVAALQRVADVYILTAPLKRSLTWAGERRDWLLKHFGINGDHIVSTASKHLVHGDVFVDDKHSSLVEWNTHRQGHPLLWYADWNSSHHGRVPGAADWPTMLQLIKERL